MYCSPKFGQLILTKIIKIVAIRCQILRPKCTPFDFGWGSALDPAGGAYSALPDSLAGGVGACLLAFPRTPFPVFDPSGLGLKFSRICFYQPERVLLALTTR